MTPWLGILEGVSQIADDLITTDEERAKLALEDRKIDAQMQQGQIEVNKVEAAHASLFVAGWRPAVGWVCAVALAMMYIPKALVITVMWAVFCGSIMSTWVIGTPPPVIPEFPDVGAMDIIGLLLALLGMAGIRSFDKAKAVDTRRIGEPREETAP